MSIATGLTFTNGYGIAANLMCIFFNSCSGGTQARGEGLEEDLIILSEGAEQDVGGDRLLLGSDTAPGKRRTCIHLAATLTGPGTTAPTTLLLGEGGQCNWVDCGVFRAGPLLRRLQHRGKFGLGEGWLWCSFYNVLLSFFQVGGRRSFYIGGRLPPSLLTVSEDTSVSGILTSESGVTMHSSGEEMSTTKQRGVGEGNPPCGQSPVASRMTTGRPELVEIFFSK